ncbi:MAG TPA: serine hydrolase [Candidatus Saccharimonadales bacterium]
MHNYSIVAAYRNFQQRKKKTSKRLVLALVAIILLVAGARLAFFRGEPEPASLAPAAPTGEEGKNEEDKKAPAKPALVNLQPVVDTWLSKQSGEYGIVVYDPANKQVIATHDADVQFFTASIYKLYTVYLALQDIEAGKHTLGESFKFGKTRQTCLHDAIHTSDSPCAEALLNEIGQAQVTARLKTFGFTGTSFPAFVTTAQDSVSIMQRLYEKRDLNQTSTNLMLEAMKTQVYRDGLPKGMPQATVATKVGFSETPHYHDVGIVTLPNGRNYLVAFFSKGVGSRVVADFGATIYEALK